MMVWCWSVLLENSFVLWGELLGAFAYVGGAVINRENDFSKRIAFLIFSFHSFRGVLKRLKLNGFPRTETRS